MKKLPIAVALLSLSIAAPVFACPEGHDETPRTAEKKDADKDTAKAPDKDTAKAAKPAQKANDAKDAKPADKAKTGDKVTQR